MLLHVHWPNRSLNLRFVKPAGLHTQAVVSLDDDIMVSCADLMHTYQVGASNAPFYCHYPSIWDQVYTRCSTQAWRASPHQLVGWFPRLHTGPPWKYHAKLATLLLHGRYSIILTKGAFLHAGYLDAYSRLPAAVHAMVDRMHNCEDLAMQFLVANTTKEPPIFVHARRLWDYGQVCCRCRTEWERTPRKNRASTRWRASAATPASIMSSGRCAWRSSWGCLGHTSYGCGRCTRVGCGGGGGTACRRSAIAMRQHVGSMLSMHLMAVDFVVMYTLYP